jgi:hypothetical protein
LLLIVTLSLRFSVVQTYLAQQLTKKLSENLNTTIHIERVNIHPLDKVTLEGVFALDLVNDTIIDAKFLEVKLASISFQKSNINIESVTLDEAKIQLIKPEGQTGFSFQFIIDYFSGEDKEDKKSSNNFTITGNRIELINSSFNFIDHRAKAIYYGMDFTDLRLRNINITLSNIKNKGSNIKARIEHISTLEKSNFHLTDFKGDVEIDSNFVHLDSLQIETVNSSLKTNFFRFEFDDPNYFEDDFENKVKMIANFKASKLNLKDLSYFTSFFEGIDRAVLFTGKFNGYVSDFKSTDLYIKLDHNTYYKGDIAMKGLPNNNLTTFNAKIDELVTNEYELEHIEIPPFTKHKRIELPKQLKGVGNIFLTGNLTGKFDDVKGNLLTRTNLGEIQSEAHYWVNKKTNTSIFNGTVRTQKFNIGKLTQLSDIKTITANLKANFVWNYKIGYDASINGKIASFFFKDYNYKNIIVDGDFNDAFFSGKANITDKNIKANFNGIIDLSKKTPEFRFKSNIESLNLDELHLTNDSVIRIICARVDVNGSGKNIDDANGNIIINDLVYYQDGIEYEAEEIEINAKTNDSSRVIELMSSIANISIDGNFKIAELPKSIDVIISKTLPALYEKRDSIKLEQQNFMFYGEVKDYSPIQELFTPGIHIEPTTSFNGDFNSDEGLFHFFSISDSIIIEKRKLENVKVDIKKLDEVLDLNITVDNLIFNEESSFENITFKSLLKDNLITPSLKWYSSDNDSYGFIQGNGYWYSVDYFDFLILPSYFHFNEHDWYTKDDASFIIEGTKLSFKDLEVRNEKDEAISVLGEISNNPNAVLKIYLDNFKINNFNTFLSSSKVKYYGTINGSTCITNVYDQAVIEADFFIDKLKANKELIGDVSLNTTWLNNTKGLACKGELFREDNNVFDFSGTYFPLEEENSLDFKCIMDKTPLAFLNTFIEGRGISEIEGYANGKINVKGSPKKPLLDGGIQFDYAGFKVEYLNTYYDFSGEFIVLEDGILTNNIFELRDMTDNIATFNGAIFHDNYKDFDFDVSIDIPKQVWVNGYDKRRLPFDGAKKVDNRFYCLNTHQQLNSDFYGNVYAVGNINIAGYKENVDITVNATTRKGTQFTLPLYGGFDVKLEEYVIFVDSTTTNIKEEKLDLEGINLDLNIEVTPDAELEIIFDEVYGDIMKGRGNGNLNISVDKNNEIKMTGKYEIEKGDYLFTLGILNFENVINKKFEIAPGGTIYWYGDPYNAEIDLNAIYKLKASLYDITTSYSDDVKARYKNRSDVECYMNLTQSLMQPNVSFEIQLPRSDETAKNALANLIQTEQELNKQVFSLLILNRFLPPANSVSNEDRSSGGALSSNASELLSNQLSNWLSKLSNNVDIGLNYRPGDNISNDEVAVALSTELLNDRLVISSNFGVSTGNEANNNPNNLIGDVNVEYKLNKDGTFRVRAFTRTNEYDITNTNQSTTSQGVGIYYKKDFDKLKDFFKKKNNKAK